MRLRRPGKKTAVVVGLMLAIGLWDLFIGNTFFSFHGRVTSIDGTPIEGATVSMDVVTYDLFQVPVLWGTMHGSTRATIAMTDRNGEFAIRGVHGRSLTVKSVTKPGYDQSYNDQQGSTFVFTGPASDQLGASNHPTYLLVPLGPSDGNVKNSLAFRVARDGKMWRVSLTEAHVLKDGDKVGDLDIAVRGPEKLDYHPTARFEWGVTIAAVDGEIVETSDVASQRAPTSGYRASYSYDFVPDVADLSKPDPKWTMRFHRQFYIRSRHGGLTAWCDIVVVPLDNGVHNQAGADLHYVYNLQGSPNLFAPQRR